MGRWLVCCCFTASSGGCGIAARRRQFPDGLPKLYNRSMRAACAMVLSAMLLQASDFQIDHVTVAGSDIRKLQAGLASIGIATVYGGAHLNNTTEMALASLPDGAYLGLMASGRMPTPTWPASTCGPGSSRAMPARAPGHSANQTCPPKSGV